MAEKTTITIERRAELTKALRDLSLDEAMSGITMLDSGETVMVRSLLGEAAAALATPSQQEKPRDDFHAWQPLDDGSYICESCETRITPPWGIKPARDGCLGPDCTPPPVDEKPECETCGDRRRIPGNPGSTMPSPSDPCPDCSTPVDEKPECETCGGEGQLGHEIGSRGEYWEHCPDCSTSEQVGEGWPPELFAVCTMPPADGERPTLAWTPDQAEAVALSSNRQVRRYVPAPEQKGGDAA